MPFMQTQPSSINEACAHEAQDTYEGPQHVLRAHRTKIAGARKKNYKGSRY